MPNRENTMKIAVLDFQFAVMSSVSGPFDIFNQLNQIVDTFTTNINIKKIEAKIVHADNLDDTQTFDLVIIPAVRFDRIQEVLAKESEVYDWLKRQYDGGAELASICLGAFILASTGLLDNKVATTHWMGAAAFRSLFPKVNLLDDKIITDHQRIYTCGGAYSFTTLIIYLVDKYFGHEVAVVVSKVFLIHLHDFKQTPFHILNLQKSHNNGDIRKVQRYIEANFTDKLNVEELSSIANMTPRTFIRKFKKSTGSTPYEYLQRIKMEKAKKLLETKDIGIEQVSYEIGYSDFASFRKVFKKNVGLNPSEYKRLYGKMNTPGHIQIQ